MRRGSNKRVVGRYELSCLYCWKYQKKETQKANKTKKDERDDIFWTANQIKNYDPVRG